jgi:hypothetical protein
MSYGVVKDPDADLDYGFDWSAWLGTDTIASSAWSVPDGSGLTAHDGAVDAAGKQTTIWLRGGTPSRAPVLVTNHVVTAGGREDDRSIAVTVAQR